MGEGWGESPSYYKTVRSSAHSKAFVIGTLHMNCDDRRVWGWLMVRLRLMLFALAEILNCLLTFFAKNKAICHQMIQPNTIIFLLYWRKVIIILPTLSVGEDVTGSHRYKLSEKQGTSFSNNQVDNMLQLSRILTNLIKFSSILLWIQLSVVAFFAESRTENGGSWVAVFFCFLIITPPCRWVVGACQVLVEVVSC